MKTQALKIDREALLAQTLRGEFPDARGRFGPFGGRYVPETLVPALDRLEQGIRDILPDPAFKAELDLQLRTWVGRPTPLTYAATLSQRWGAEVWLKREDLAHTGALASDDHTLEDLDALAVPLNDTDVHLDGVAGAKCRDVLTQVRMVHDVGGVHDLELLETRPAACGGRWPPSNECGPLILGEPCGANQPDRQP